MLAASSAKSHLFTAFSPVLPGRVQLIPNKFPSGASALQKRTTKNVSQNQELVGGSVEKRNWKGMLIAILVILIVCGFVVLAVILSAEEERKINYVQKEDVTKKSWLNGLAQHSKWKGDDLIWQDRWKNIKFLNHRMQQNPFNESSIFIKNTTLQRYGAQRYEISNDGKFALFIYKIKPKYSKSFDASYEIYNLKTKQVKQLTHNKGSNATFQYANFGPKASDIIYVFDGDLYHIKDAARAATAYRITNNSKSTQRITSGLSDWLYEEEVLHTHIAHWWSEDGNLLAFAEFDDQNVPQSFVTKYMKDSNLEKASLKIYPKKDSYSCPKTGLPQPKVTIKVFDKTTKLTTTFPAPEKLHLTLMQSVVWTRNNHFVLITWSDRTQREAMVQACEVRTGKCRDDVTAVSPNNREGWIYALAQQAPLPAAGPSSEMVFFWLMPLNQGKHGNFKHVVIVNFTEETPESSYLTDGLFDVVQLLHFNFTSKSLYFVSKEHNRKEQHIYQMYIDMDNLRSKPSRKCLTCNNVVKGCLFYEADFSLTNGKVRLDCLGPKIPASYIGSLDGDTWDTNPTQISDELDDDTRFRLNTSNFEFQDEFVTFSRNGHDVNAQIIMPNEIEPGKFGIVVEIGDIGSHSVNYEYKLGFLEYLTSRYNIYTVRVDGAGSGLGGENILHAGNDDPAKEIIKDVDGILKFMDDQLKLSLGAALFIGKGFGGYVAIASLLDPQNEHLPCSIAISPIVDWEAHTSVPSEKIFGLFSDNMRKYQNNNLLRSKLTDLDKHALIFHGLSDRKVHHQHTIALTEVASHNLINAVLYANQDHVMTSARDQYDIMDKSHDFVLQCFKDSPLSV